MNAALDALQEATAAAAATPTSPDATTQWREIHAAMLLFKRATNHWSIDECIQFSLNHLTELAAVTSICTRSARFMFNGATTSLSTHMDSFIRSRFLKGEATVQRFLNHYITETFGNFTKGITWFASDPGDVGWPTYHRSTSCGPKLVGDASVQYKNNTRFWASIPVGSCSSRAL
jgi:hypothetical protein